MKICFNLILFSFLMVSLQQANAQSKYTDNEAIISLLKKKRNYNKENATIYKIQLYNGTETSAKNIQKKFALMFDENPILEYESPEWKVQVGAYDTKIKAQRALNKIKEKFAGAIIIRYRKSK